MDDPGIVRRDSLSWFAGRAGPAFGHFYFFRFRIVHFPFLGRLVGSAVTRDLGTPLPSKGKRNHRLGRTNLNQETFSEGESSKLSI